ncbi:beta-lactamase family protein [candidate division WOR-3 bacterium]|nr:beta-lactamase family protein [candidate division WOR-3 bacterium]
MGKLIPIAAILAFVLTSCTYEVERPSSAIDCYMDFSDHPRDSIYQRIVDEYVVKGLPGLVVLIRTPEDGLWIGCAGYANIEDGVEMNPCHLHHSASVAKTYGAALALRLVEEGKLNLDAKISNCLPSRITDNLPNGKKVTVRQLLNHTSGIPEYNKDVFYMIDIFNDVTREFTREELLEYVYGKPALFEPGEGWEYANTNYLLLGLIMDSVTGDHVKAMQEFVIDPLDIENTYYYNNPCPPGVVNSYWDRYGNGKLENNSDWQLHFGTADVLPADGIIASALDYATFFEAVCRDSFLSSESFEAMTGFVGIPENPDARYGLGLTENRTEYGTWIGHSGSTLGSAGMVQYMPEKDITIVMYTNVGTFFSTPFAKMFYDDLREEILAAVFEGE